MYSQQPPYYRERSLSSPSAPPVNAQYNVTPQAPPDDRRGSFQGAIQPPQSYGAQPPLYPDIGPSAPARDSFIQQNYNQNYGPPQQSSQNLRPPPAPTQQPPAPFLRDPTLHGGYGPVQPGSFSSSTSSMAMMPDGMAPTPASVVELRFRCKGLKKSDFLSQSDPFVVIYMQEAQKKGWREVGRTETIMNTPDPAFAKSFQVDFFFEEVQRLRVEVFDRDSSSERLSDHDFLGCVEITMGQLMSSKGQSAVLKLLQNDKGRGHVHNLSGHVVIDAEEVATCADMINVRFTATKLDNKDGWFGASDPFLNVYRLRDTNCDPLATSSWILVWRSEVVMNNCDPKWRRATLSVQKLCNGDLSKLLKFECMDWEKNGRHQFIGSCTVKAAEFVTGERRSMDLINRERQAKKGKRYKNSGMLVLEQIDMFKQHTFAEYLRGGCVISLVVGIDYTASNGSPSDPGSLHYMGGNYQGQMNDYQAAITATGAILEPYDADKRFPVYGFGGLVNGVVNHCFPLTFDPSQPEVEGIGGIMSAYSNSFQFVHLHGPTKFAPLVHQAAAIARTFSAPVEQGGGGNLKYFVLLIITDGAIMDMQETIDELVQASMLPLSIVIVAVGNADFTAMNALDADDKLLVDSRRQKAARDIVQFVPFNQFRRNPARLAKETLAEIPTQLLQYYNMKGIQPRTPLQRQGTSYLPSPNAKRDEILGADVVISVPVQGSESENVPTGVKHEAAIDQLSFDIPAISNNTRTVTNVAQQTIIAGAEHGRKNNESLRSNLIALALVLSYIAVSILVFHFVEDWSVIDCVYYAMVIVTTVGYGDVTPKTTAGKAFTIFFAFYGICTIGVALGQLASWFLQRQKHVTKMATRKLLSNVENAAATARSTASFQSKEAKMLEKDQPKSHWKRFQTSLPSCARKVFSKSNRALVHAVVPIVVSILSGLIVGAIEGWHILDCFYYTIITITTVGFGDFSPKSPSAKLYAIFYLPLAVVTVAHGVGSILNEFSARSVMKTKISMKELLDMDADGDGKVSKLEYLSYMLVKLNKADQDDIDGIIAQFHKLDRDGSGELDRDDLERLDRELQRQNEDGEIN